MSGRIAASGRGWPLRGFPVLPGVSAAEALEERLAQVIELEQEE